jgi:hypothetical protein
MLVSQTAAAAAHKPLWTEDHLHSGTLYAVQPIVFCCLHSSLVSQVLRRVLDSKVGWGKLQLVHTTTTRTASTAVGTTPDATAAVTTTAAPGAGGGVGGATTRVEVRLSSASTPLHVMVDVDVLGPIGKAKAPLTTPEVANQLLASIRYDGDGCTRCILPFLTK